MIWMRTSIMPIVLVGLMASAAVYAQEAMRETMLDLAQSLSTLLKASATPISRTNNQTRAEVDTALDTVDVHANALARHLERDDTAFLAAALTRHVRLLRVGIQDDNSEAFELALDRTIGTCVSCHARTTSRSTAALTQALVPQEIEDALPTARRARVQMATRRFDTALKTLQQSLPNLRGEALANATADYLDLAVRVLSRPGHAEATLETLTGTGSPIEPYLPAWRESIAVWAASPQREPSLGTAREALERARASGDINRGRIDYLRAANEAQQWLEQGSGGDLDSAEANLILGTAEFAIATSAWLPLPELYLEQAIRLAPASPTARDALGILQQALSMRFGEVPLPLEVDAYLNELRRLATTGGGT